MEYSTLTLNELNALIKEQGIKIPKGTRINKANLIELLKKHDEEVDFVEEEQEQEEVDLPAGLKEELAEPTVDLPVVSKDDEIEQLKLEILKLRNEKGGEKVIKKEKDALERIIESYYPSEGLTGIKKATRLIRVNIINQDSEQLERKSELVNIGTVNQGYLCRRVIIYGEPQVLEYVGVRALNEKTYQYKENYYDKNEKVWKIRTHTRKKYLIDVLPPFKEQELEDIRKRQLAQGNE